MDGFPLHRFEEYGALTVSERDAVLALPDAPITIEKRRAISREGDDTNGFFILMSGWVAASHLLPDGGRQIMKFHLPGDALGTPSMAMKRTTESLVALTNVVIGRVPLSRFGKLFESHPRVVARFMLSIQQERIALMDRLIAIGRTSAQARVAAFLLDLTERLAPVGLYNDGCFQMVPTQAQIGDLLSLTSVHVNRTLAILAEQGLMERRGKDVRIINAAGLAAIAHRPKRVRFPDQDWLPAAR